MRDGNVSPEELKRQERAKNLDRLSRAAYYVLGDHVNSKRREKNKLKRERRALREKAVSSPYKKKRRER